MIRLGSSAYVAVLVVLVAAFVVGYLLFRAGGTGFQSYRLAGQEQQVRRDIAELQRQHEELVALREYLRSDEYIESVARRVLGLVKPGRNAGRCQRPAGRGGGGSNAGERPAQSALVGRLVRALTGGRLM